jgi:hypothetical protein
MIFTMIGNIFWLGFIMVLTLGFANLPLACIYFANHTSLRLDPQFISDYIPAEQQAGRYSIGYSPDELEQIIGPFHITPLGLMPKPHTDIFRLIQDYSYPHDDSSLLSVHVSINSDNFPTTWGTFN